MICMLYKFTKRKNSTKYPSVQSLPDPYLRLEGEFNYGCDIDNIEIKFTIPAENSHKIFDYNYCVINDWKRLYYISNWEFDKGYAIAYCNCDLFATFRSNIFNAYAMVNRMAYLNNDSTYGRLVNDNLYPASNVIETRRTIYNANNMFSANPSEGVFVISVLSINAPVYGAVNYYVLSATQFATLVQNMVANSSGSAGNWQNTDLSSQMLKSIVSPMQYITSCRWLPIKIDSTVYPLESIYLGPWNSGASGRKITGSAAPEVSGYGKVIIPDVPQDISTNNLANMKCYSFPPYAKYTMFNSLFGVIEIDGNAITAVREVFANSAIQAYLDLRITVNVITGTCILRLYAPTTNRNILPAEPNDFNLLFQIDKRVNADIPLAEISTNYVEMAKAGISTVAGIASTVTGVLSKNAYGAVQGIEKTLTSGIDTLKYAMSPEVKSNSANGGSGFYSNIYEFNLQGAYYRTVKTDFKETGRAVTANAHIYDIVYSETSPYTFSNAVIYCSFINIPMVLTTSRFPPTIELDGQPAMTTTERDNIIEEIYNNGLFCE